MLAHSGIAPSAPMPYRYVAYENRSREGRDTKDALS